MTVFFTSDLHFGHEKEFLFGPRGFDSVSSHASGIIQNWNSVVTEEDDVYVLGDMMLNDDDFGIACIKALKGKIHIIVGNHDSAKRIEKYEEIHNVVSVSFADRVKINGFTFFLSHYPTITSNSDEDKPIKARVINLCGHTHTKDRFADMDKGFIYHVELDAHNNTPVTAEEIIKDIKKWVEKH